MAAAPHHVPPPLTTALRARSASVAYQAASATMRPTLLRCQRAYMTGSLAKRLTCYAGARINRVNSLKGAGVRSKSSWNHNRGKWVGFGWGMHRAWHRPGCKWVGAQGDPKSTPRDKECPACQDEESLPFELSPRELRWQRQLEEMKRFLVKDPYEALFGYSNRMLSGRPFYMPPHFPWSEVTVRHHGKPSEMIPKKSPGDVSNDSTNNTGTKETSTASKSETFEQSPVTSYPNQNGTFSAFESTQEISTSSNNKGYAKWKVSGLDAGKPFSASGEFAFDPITMKMMPKVSEKEQSTLNSPNPTSLTKVDKIHVAKFAPQNQHITRFEARPSALRQTIDHGRLASESVSGPSTELAPQTSSITDAVAKVSSESTSSAVSSLYIMHSRSETGSAPDSSNDRPPQSWKHLKTQLLALKQNLVKLEVLARRIEHQQQGSTIKANSDACSSAASFQPSEETLRLKHHLTKLSQHILTMMRDLDHMSKPSLKATGTIDDKLVQKLISSISTLKRGLFKIDQEVFKGIQRLELISDATAPSTATSIQTLVGYVNAVKATQGQLMQDFLEATLGPNLSIKPQPSHQERSTEVLSIHKQLMEAKQGLKKANQDLLKAKGDLERSWAKEYQARVAGLQEREVDPAISTDASPKSQYSAMQSRRNSAYRRFTREELVKYARQSILKKDKPLKHMSINELKMHRAALMRAWAAKTEPGSPSAADKKLQEEVKAQKTAYAAFENKWSGRNKASTQEISVPAPNSTTAKVEDTYPQGEGDLGLNAAKFATNSRWYKKKAPHAMATEEKAAKDRLLVQDIQKIYEDVYGKITVDHQQKAPDVPPRRDSPTSSSAAGTEVVEEIASPAIESYESRIAALQSSLSRHCQPKSSKSTEGDSSRATTPNPRTTAQGRHNTNVQTTKDTKAPTIDLKDPALYKVLAYDKRDQAIHIASASSTFHPPTETIISASEALPRLHNPAKYLPYLAEQQNEGYEIVSANKNLLVFKRVRPSTATFPVAKKSSASIGDGQVNPVDLTGRQSPYPKTHTGNFASPTGFVNHDPISITPPAAQAKTCQSSRRVIKQEPVFSGTNKKWNWEEYKPVPTTISEDSVRNHAYVNSLREQSSSKDGRPRSSSQSNTQADAIRAREAAHRQDILRTIVDSSSSSASDGNNGNNHVRSLSGTNDAKTNAKSRKRYWREYVLGIPPYQRSITKTILYSLPRAAFDLITLLAAIYLIGAFIENRREKRKYDEALKAHGFVSEAENDHGQMYWGKRVEKAMEKERSQNPQASLRNRSAATGPLVNAQQKDLREPREERLLTKDNVAFAGFCFMAGTVWWMAVRAFWNS